jgi:hypothetical protein
MVLFCLAEDTLGTIECDYKILSFPLNVPEDGLIRISLNNTPVDLMLFRESVGRGGISGATPIKIHSKKQEAFLYDI